MIVKRLRTKNGWSQDHLATLSGLSLRTIQLIGTLFQLGGLTITSYGYKDLIKTENNNTHQHRAFLGDSE
jgi:transcriptional regulator with XRE-family HTH domain